MKSKSTKTFTKFALTMCKAFLSALLILAVVAGGLVMDTALADAPLGPIAPAEPYVEEPTPDNGMLKGGKMRLIYSPEASLNLTTGKIQMYYNNPADSLYEVVVTLYIVTTDAEGEEIEIEIAESKPILPGKIRTVMELSIDKSLLFEGRYDARYHLKIVEVETGDEVQIPTILDGICLTARKK